MTHPIDLHDTISVIIPGAFAVSFVIVFSHGGVAEILLALASASMSNSLLFLVCSYVIGLFLQEAGKWFVKHISIYGQEDDPYYWVLNEQVPSDFLPAADCKKLLTILKQRHAWKIINHEETPEERKRREKAELQSCFYPIKIRVYAHDAYRSECIKMLSKLHFFSSIMVLSVLIPIVYALMVGYSLWVHVPTCQHVSCLCCCASHSHYCLGEALAVFLISIICGRAAARFHQEFNKTYNRCLFSSYLAIAEQK